MRVDSMVGTEFDWMAVDGDGRLGLFSTAGLGPVPEAALEHQSEHAAIVNLVAKLGGLPAWADLLSFCGNVPVFVYDWEHWSGPYRRAQIPAKGGSLKLSDLPEDLRTFVVRLDLSFEESLEVLPSQLGLVG